MSRELPKAKCQSINWTDFPELGLVDRLMDGENLGLHKTWNSDHNLMFL